MESQRDIIYQYMAQNIELKIMLQLTTKYELLICLMVVIGQNLTCLDCSFALKAPSAKKMPLEQVWLKSEHSLHAYTFDYVKDCKCGYDSSAKEKHCV